MDSRKTDSHGAPQLRIDFTFSDNEHKLLADATHEAAAMLSAAGGRVLMALTARAADAAVGMLKDGSI